MEAACVSGPAPGAGDTEQTILTYSVFPELGVGLGSATCGYETVGKSKTSGPQAPPGRWVTALSLRCRKDCG
jgi:hypothetical protein